MATETKKRTKRRGNGEGSIFLRGDGKWTATITIGYDGQGKRKRRTVYGKTKKVDQDADGQAERHAGRGLTAYRRWLLGPMA